MSAAGWLEVRERYRRALDAREAIALLAEGCRAVPAAALLVPVLREVWTAAGDPGSGWGGGLEEWARKVEEVAPGCGLVAEARWVLAGWDPCV